MDVVAGPAIDRLKVHLGRDEVDTFNFAVAPCWGMRRTRRCWKRLHPDAK